MRLTLKPHENIIFSLAVTLILSSASYYFTFDSRAQIVNQANANNLAPQRKYRATVEMLDAFIRREMSLKFLTVICLMA